MFSQSVDPLVDSGMHNLRNCEFISLLPESVTAELQRKRQFLTWFFPADKYNGCSVMGYK